MTALVARPRGRAIPPLEPGSPDWLRVMSASKIAAAVGLSPYESRFSLWHRMAGMLPQPDLDPRLARGHYLEPGIRAWFADQHPDWTVLPGGCWAHPDEPRFTASPDGRLALPADAGSCAEHRLLEIKTAADSDEWGPAGSDEIPVGYRCQLQWQMDVLGLEVAHVAVLLPFLEMREYVIAYDPDDAATLRTAGREFLDSLPDGPHPQRPDIDTHDATYEAVRQLHPDIDRERDVELRADLALRYLAAEQALRRAKAEHQQAKSELLDAMGSARRALYLDRPIAMRKPARGGAVALTCTDPDVKDQP